MAKYRAVRDTWLSHECRMAKAGEEFDTNFPEVNGKPMRLGDNLELVEGEAKAKGGKKSDDALV